MSAFDEAFAHTVGVEGGFSDNPNDGGGKTKYGITEAVARAFGYADDMRDLPYSTAKGIYLERYWAYMRLDDVAKVFPRVAKKLFDAGVNCGQANAVKWLQMALNSFNRQGRLYADVGEDGGMGRITLYALSQYATARKNEDVLLEAVDSQQGTYYLNLARSKPTQEEFTFGWFSNRIGNF